MSNLILYYTLASPPSRAVLMLANEIGLNLELKNINTAAGEHLRPEFLKLNPLHTIPTLDDNGTIIWDSHAIMAYLVDKYATNDQLYPKDLAQRAYVNQRLIFDASCLFERLLVIIKQVLLQSCTEFDQSQVASIYKSYDLLESLFTNGNLYVVGNNLTIGDISCISSIASVRLFFPIDEKKYPKITAWIKRLKQLPYYDDINQKGSDLLFEKINQRLDANIKIAENKRK